MNNIIPGQQLGPYRIIAQVGQGGMAAVYKAYHAAMDRYVAVKVLPSEFAKSAAFMGRFQQEARTVANLEHPHILPVHDFGESEGVHFFVMRYLETGTLASRIEQSLLTLAEVDSIFSQLAGALSYAHQRNVVHRDLKPSNVLIDSRGDIFLTDFGIAKLLEGSSKFTTTGTITGTPAYMSPEQAQGERIDQRSDIYSLGIVLYEMLTGRVPFDAETPLAVLLKHVSAPLPLPTEIKADIHPEIERVLLKALAKNRDDRYATCEEFLRDWKSAVLAAQTGRNTVVQAQPVTRRDAAKPPTKLPTQPGPSPRSRGLPVPLLAALGLGAVAVLCIVVLAFGGLFLSRFFPGAATAIAQTAGPTTGPGTVLPLFPTTESATAVAPPLPEGDWESWAAGNSIYTVAVSGERVFAAGWGSVNIWNRIDGSHIDTITTADGLPDSDISSIYAESEDSFWVGTEHGLVHFEDGEVTLFDSQDGLDSEFVSAIAPQRDGSLIVGTYYSDPSGGGLNVLGDRNWRRVEDFPSGDPNVEPDKLSYMINTIFDDGTFLWVGTENGLGRFDGQVWTRFSTDDGLPHNNILALNLDPTTETLLIGTQAGATAFDGDQFSPTPASQPDNVFAILGTAADDYWLSGGGGLYRINLESGDTQVYNSSNSPILTYGLYRGAVDADGTMYFGTDWGLLVVEEQTQFDLWLLDNVPGGGAFAGILAEPEGRLWFQHSSASGFDIFDQESNEWQEIPEVPGFPILIDEKGNLWSNEWPSGLWITSPDGQSVRIGEAEGLPADAFVRGVVIAPDGTIWLSTDNHGLATFNGQTITGFITSSETGLSSDFIRDLFVSNDGSLWASGDVDLAHRKPDGSWETFGAGNPFGGDSAQIYSIGEDTLGNIWAGSGGSGVYRYRDGQWTQYTYDSTGRQLPGNIIFSITGAPDGSVWVGTDGGAARFDGAQWQGFLPSPDELIDRFVNDIYITEDGVVYFATEGGVSRFEPK